MRSKLASIAGVTLAVVLAAMPLDAQTVRGGALLVATPDLADPNFAQAVVLLLRHDRDATIGVIVNRITSLVPTQVFPEFSPALDAYEGKLFRGGPVAPTRVLFLITGLAAAVAQGPEVLEGLYVSIEPEQLPELAALADGPNGLRLYAGHAEWTPGQIEEEIAAGYWRVVPGDIDLVFGDPRVLWEQASTLGAAVAYNRAR